MGIFIIEFRWHACLIGKTACDMSVLHILQFLYNTRIQCNCVLLRMKKEVLLIEEAYHEKTPSGDEVELSQGEYATSFSTQVRNPPLHFPVAVSAAPDSDIALLGASLYQRARPVCSCLVTKPIFYPKWSSENEC
jgi:hypothetical protein